VSEDVENDLCSVAVTSEQMHVLCHAIGFDKTPPQVRRHVWSLEECYRNRYVAGAGHDRWGDLQVLCELGLMRNRGNGGDMTGGDDVFVVTERGFRLVRAFFGGAS
jgi:hypothetical protein